jgi:flagellar hook-associated protein 1 FlgK
MPSIFNSLGIGYSGLNMAQAGIDTTSHNISNAETEGYTRQRVISSAATPLSASAGNVGNGVKIDDIKRVFDNFVFDRYNGLSSDKAYSDFQEKTLTELSSYFPEIDNVGVKADLTEYYNMWQTFADNPGNSSIKLSLAKQTQTLSDHINQTQGKILSLQSQLNDQLGVNINEVNSVAKELASVNKEIDIAESGGIHSANDLRDKRNVLENTLSKLIGAKVNSSNLTSNTNVDASANTRSGSYSVTVGGFNIVDGSTYHPLKLNKADNQYGFYSIAYERQDATLIPMEKNISGGVIGSILDLRGGAVDSTSGMPTDGILQNAISQFDAFGQSLIESTNNLYAASSTQQMTSNVLDINPSNALVNSGYNINKGSFDVVMYDLDGNETARRTINITDSTLMTGVAGSNSIQGQLEAKIDDNGDGNANNDVNNFVNFNWATFANGDKALELTLDPLAQSKGYTFAIVDNTTTSAFASGTNFAGALGMSRFLDGDSARNIKLNNTLSANPTKISAGYGNVAGDNRVALNMVQHQFEKFNFQVGDLTYNATTYGMFDLLSTDVGTATNTAISKNKTVTAQYNATKLEYSSVSKVSIDEEMTNLIKYQTSYTAAAKVITTIDQMMQTLLGIKQ